jgi:hypothetical protein
VIEFLESNAGDFPTVELYRGAIHIDYEVSQELLLGASEIQHSKEVFSSQFAGVAPPEVVLFVFGAYQKIKDFSRTKARH